MGSNGVSTNSLPSVYDGANTSAGRPTSNARAHSELGLTADDLVSYKPAPLLLGGHILALEYTLFPVLGSVIGEK